MIRIKTIDGLRGIAVLMVLAFHYINNPLVYTNDKFKSSLIIVIEKLTSFGWAGVNLFFVISGYLIGRILFSNKDKLYYFKTFYIRRFFRIIPIYFLLLGVYFFVLNTVEFKRDIILFEKPIPFGYFLGLVQNFYMSVVGHFGPNALTPTWSLAVEEQFYIVIPVLIYLISKDKIPYLLLGLIALSITFRCYSTNWYMEYTHLFSRMDAPLLGVLLAHSHIYKSRVGKIFNSTILMTLVIFVFTVCFLFLKQLNHTLIALIFVTILNALIKMPSQGFLHRILTSKSVLFFGKYSYFIYLFHQIINGLFFLIFLKSNPRLESGMDYLITGTSFALTCLFAVLSYKLIESRFIGFSHKFNYQEKEN